MTNYIARETFRPDFIQDENRLAAGTIIGTVEVTLGCETRRVRAVKWLDESISAYGLRGRNPAQKTLLKVVINSLPNREDALWIGGYSNLPMGNKTALIFA